MAAIEKVSRRDFVKVTGAAGAGLVIGFHLPHGGESFASPVSDGPFMPNAWFQIDAEGVVTFWVHRSPLGQGVRTSLPMILAEELEIDWPKFKIAQADADPKYGSQTTGGSASVRTSWMPLRKAGATGRAMLITAAAETWSVDPSTCHASKGQVIHQPSGRALTYGELAEKAATLPVPDDPPLKDPKDFRIIGTPMTQLDAIDRASGRTVFGMDVRLPGMVYACVARCPEFGGTVKSFDAAPAKAVAGVLDVIEVDSGVAVIAESTWAAIKGRDALKVEFDHGPSPDLSSATISKMLDERQAQPGVATREDGDCEAVLSNAANVMEATYDFPYLSHAPLEPMNCTAHAREDGIEVWAPTQAPQWARGAVAQTLGVPPETVTIHVVFSGGAFGRRIMPDFVIEAVRVSQATGSPVQVVWTREDDMHHDWYRPVSRHLLSGGLDEGGKLIAWKHRVVSPSIVAHVLNADEAQAAGEATDGASNIPYTIPNVYVDHCMINTSVPTGWWRSVFNPQTAFANECFIDELAHLAGKDPYEFRMAMLAEAPRHRGVLELAAKKAGWTKSPPAGRHRGIALHFSFQSWVAEVAEVSVADDGSLTVHKVVAAVDCGRVVNPEGVRAQIEGGIIFGLSALKGAITIEDGRVVQGNFHDYPLMDFGEAPEVEVHIVDSDVAPTGVGEPGVPPAAAAVANAIFAATGVRVRQLPIQKEDLKRA